MKTKPEEEVILRFTIPASVHRTITDRARSVGVFSSRYYREVMVTEAERIRKDDERKR